MPRHYETRDGGACREVLPPIHSRGRLIAFSSAEPSTRLVPVLSSPRFSNPATRHSRLYDGTGSTRRADRAKLHVEESLAVTDFDRARSPDPQERGKPKVGKRSPGAEQNST